MVEAKTPKYNTLQSRVQISRDYVQNILHS